MRVTIPQRLAQSQTPQPSKLDVCACEQQRQLRLAELIREQSQSCSAMVAQPVTVQVPGLQRIR
jgi:hypothetical protein